MLQHTHKIIFIIIKKCVLINHLSLMNVKHV